MPVTTAIVGGVFDPATHEIDARADGDPSRVRRIIGRFGAQVLLPSTITVRLHPAQRIADEMQAVPYSVLTADGGRAIDRGVVVIE